MVIDAWEAIRAHTKRLGDGSSEAIGAETEEATGLGLVLDSHCGLGMAPFDRPSLPCFALLYFALRNQPSLSVAKTNRYSKQTLTRLTNAGNNSTLHATRRQFASGNPPLAAR